MQIPIIFKSRGLLPFGLENYLELRSVVLILSRLKMIGIYEMMWKLDGVGNHNFVYQYFALPIL
jgi:hypothetical protein